MHNPGNLLDGVTVDRITRVHVLKYYTDHLVTCRRQLQSNNACTWNHHFTYTRMGKLKNIKDVLMFRFAEHAAVVPLGHDVLNFFAGNKHLTIGANAQKPYDRLARNR